MTYQARKDRPLYLQITLIAGFIFITFILFALARSIYRDSFQIRRYIDDSLNLIESGKNVVTREQAELSYAETPQYQEKTAKALLGLRAAGEKVIVLTAEEQDIDTLLPNQDFYQKKHELKLLTNPEKWLRYLFEI